MNVSITGTPPTHEQIKRARQEIERKQHRLHLFYIFSLYVIPAVTVVGTLIGNAYTSSGNSQAVVVTGVAMLAIAAAGHAFHFQGYATMLIGFMICGISLYAIPAALVMVPAGIILQHKPKAWSREAAMLLQVNDEKEKNITEMKFVSETIGAYCRKVRESGRTYFIRGEYLAMVEQREREIREHNEKMRFAQQREKEEEAEAA